MTHLVSLHLYRAPGMPAPIRLDDFGEGLVLLVGPNASGKSTVGRVLRAGLWSDEVSPSLQAVLRFGRRGGGEAVAEIGAGRVSREGDFPPVPAAAAGAWTLTVSDLLSPAADTDRDLARRLERELYGGFDLRAARAAFRASSRPPRQLRKARDGADDELRRALDGADELARRERELGLLRERQREAERAGRQADLATMMLERLDTEAELARVQAELAALPEGLTHLADDAPARVRAAAERVVAARRARDVMSRRCRELEGELEALGLPEVLPEPSEIAAWRQAAAQLREDRGRARQAARDVGVARTRLEEARAEPLVPGRAADPPDAAALDELGRALTARRHCEVEHRAVAAALDLLEPPDPSLRGRSLADLDVGIATLRGWLRLPERPDPARTPPTWPLVAIGACAALCLLGAALGRWWALLPAALAFLALGALWKARVERRAEALHDPSSLRRRSAQQTWPPSLTPPEWTRGGVQERLAGLEQLTDRLRRELELSVRRRHLLGELQQRRERLEAAQRMVTARLDRLGLDPAFAALSLLGQGQRLLELTEARRGLAESTAAHRALEAAVEGKAAALGAWLHANGRRIPRVGAEDGEGVDGLVAALEELADALGRHAVMMDERRRLLGAAPELEQELTDASAALRELWERLGIPEADERLLADRLTLLPAMRELGERRRELLARIRVLETRVDDETLRALGREELERRIADLERSAAELTGRTEAVTKLQQQVEDAGSSTRLTALGAESARTAEAFAEARATACEDAIGRELIDWLSAELERAQTPAVLGRARRWLLTFTHGRYHLEVDADRGFVARDLEQGPTRGLGELSDGTRMQALLAARLAWLEQSEGEGEPLPLFLDEVLSTTDPERFAAVARCLVELVAAGRQVVYAAADPAEARALMQVWSAEGGPPPSVVRMPDPRGLAAKSWPEELPAVPIRLPAVPAPGPLDATAYAALVGAPRPELWQPWRGWSVVHALHDELEDAHALLAGGVKTLGPLVELVKNEVPLPVSPEVAARAARWARVLEAILAALRVGRSRPVPWQEVLASRAIGSFSEAVERAWKDCDQGADELIKAVAAIPRFRAKSLRRLREHLAAGGYLDDRPTLALEQVGARAAAVLAREDPAQIPPLAELRARVEWVAAVCGLS